MCQLNTDMIIKLKTHTTSSPLRPLSRGAFTKTIVAKLVGQLATKVIGKLTRGYVLSDCCCVLELRTVLDTCFSDRVPSAPPTAFHVS